MTDLAAVVADRRIVVCCGSGGVGKTTTAAVVALEGARMGRRAIVVTIDPARRLADALGLRGGLSDVPRRIEHRRHRGARAVAIPGAHFAGDRGQ